MQSNPLVSLGSQKSAARANGANKSIWLVKPPYFTPWAPPLSISILKSFLSQHGYSVRCMDLNTDPILWGMHHKYFAALQSEHDVSTNDGYSKLWSILNAHMLAFVNGASPQSCARVASAVAPLFNIRLSKGVTDSLVALIEKYFKRLDELIDKVDFSRFSTVGTSTYTTSLSSSLFILRKVKQNYPRVKTVMGGGVFADDLALGSDNLDTLIEQYSYVDHIVLGEGELLFLGLLEGQLSDKRVISIADLNGATLSMRDVPSPDFSDFDPNNYYHLTIEGARSCPFQCSFCSETVQWGDYRKKPADLFASQVIDLATDYKMNSFFLGDSLMNPYINDFSKELMESNSRVLYDGYLRSDKPVTNRERVKQWAESGLYRVRLGIESASARVLSAMDKMTTPGTISEVLKSLSSAGIRTTTYWIVGFPGETNDDFEETLEFVRDHHRFIYELEAHPYYYYPYGQIGSRLYKSYSIYPDEVTEAIKFKSWDIPDISPNREERFERLRTLTKLASDLGIPNIYTMAERYGAEDRWQLMHPLAVEVYEGSDLFRGPARAIKRPIRSAAQPAAPQPEHLAGSQRLLCYRIKSGGPIHEETLAASLKELIRYNEMLQMKLVDGQLLPEDEQADFDLLSENLLQRLDANITEDDLEDWLLKMAADLRPEPGASVRVALRNNPQQGAELFFFAHRAIADARSAAILLEELFRIYRQLSNGLPVMLGRVEKSYSDLMTLSSIEPLGSEPDWLMENSSAANHSERSSSSSVLLDVAKIRKGLSRISPRSDLHLNHAILLALLRSCPNALRPKGLEPDINIDMRGGDAAFERTVGPLTGIIHLPALDIENGDLAYALDSLKNSLKAGSAAMLDPARPKDANRVGRNDSVLFNMEYATELWLGGDSWTANGFFIARGKPTAGYLIEITPNMFEDKLEVIFNYSERGEAVAHAQDWIGRLQEQWQILSAKAENYARAQEAKPSTVREKFANEGFNF